MDSIRMLMRVNPFLPLFCKHFSCETGVFRWKIIFVGLWRKVRVWLSQSLAYQMPTRLDGGGGPGLVCLIELYNTSTPCIFCCFNGLFDKYIHIWQHFEHTIRFVHAYIHWLNIFAIASAFWSQHLFARTLVALSLSLPLLSLSC